MELDRLQAVLRRRNPWESMDLGLAMARRWAGPMWAAWTLSVLPAYVLLWLILWDWPLLALAVGWWLRPLWDHAPLHVLSRALFGGGTGLRGSLRGSFAQWPRDLLGKLFFRRLLPWRTLVAPVSQLEGLSGPAARRRRGVLARALSGHGIWLSLLGVLLELAVASGLLGAGLMLLPDEPRFDFDVLVEGLFDGLAPAWIQLMVPTVAFVAMTLVEPLVVAAGFGLYINRRTVLEGWDVELVFRRLKARLTAAGRAALLLLAVAAGGRTATAQVPLPEDEVVARTLDEVMAEPEFGHEETQTRWQLKSVELRGFLEGCSADEQPRPDAPDLGLGALLEVLLWALFGALLVGAALLLVSRRSDRLRDQPAVLLGEIALQTGDLVPPPLPDDPPAQARRLWAAGRRDEALAVLYRSALTWLVEERALVVPEGATEGEVLRLARRALSGGALDLFARLTRARQQVAYAHRPLDPEAFEDLCAGWPALAGGGRP